MPRLPKGKPEKLFRVWCGDEALHFRYTEKYRRKESEIVGVITEAMSKCRWCGRATDFAIGLVLEDEEGRLWEPHVQVTLKPKENP